MTISEVFKVGGGLSLDAPLAADIGVSTVVTGKLENGGGQDMLMYLDASIDNGAWTASIDGPTSFLMAAGSESNIAVNVTCPPVVSVGEQAMLTITVTNIEAAVSARTTMTGVYYDGVVVVAGVENGADPSSASGTDWEGRLSGAYHTNVFTLTNAGPLSVTLTNYTLTGDPGSFSVSGLSAPLLLEAGETADFNVVYYYDGLASHAATLTLQDNKPWSPFVMNMAGFTWTISTNSGAKRGGNEVVIHCANLGSGADINQVQVGGRNAEMVDQGTDWVSFIVPAQAQTGLVDVKVGSISQGTKTMKACYYVNPIGTFSDVVPAYSYYTGGAEVVISGTNFCNGSMDDVTNVTLAGVSATLVSVEGSTQVTVRAGASLPGKGSIVIESFTHGRCELPDGFAYEGPDFQLYGRDYQVIENQAAASEQTGSDFGFAPVNGLAERTFLINNSNAAPLHITSIVTNGADGDCFEVLSLSSATVEQQVGSQLKIRFRPTSPGSKSVTLLLNSDAPDAPFILNLAGTGIEMSPVQGPMAGGNSVTISNFTFQSPVTAVMVGSQSATIEAQSIDRIRFTVPPGQWPGGRDIQLIQDGVTNVITSAYSYNRRGRIFGAAQDDWTQWETLPSIPGSAVFRGVGHYDDYVVALGGSVNGVCETGMYYYDGFEWHTGPDLPFPWAGMSVASEGGALYVIGGYTNTLVSTFGDQGESLGAKQLQSAWSFDGDRFAEEPGELYWTLYGSSHMGVGVVDGKINLFGGCYSKVSSGNLYVTPQMHILTHQGNGSWLDQDVILRASASTSDRGVMHCGTTVLSNKAYLVGGFWGDDEEVKNKAFVYDGSTNLTAVANLPQALGRVAVGTVSGQVYAAGGSSMYYNRAGTYFSDKVYRLGSSGWQEVSELQLPVNGGQFFGGVSVHDRFYAIGPVSYAYPKRTYDSGVSPTGCAAEGGVQITISGRNLCDGTMDDVTQVLLAGNAVSSIDSVSSTQIVVTAAPGSGAVGDVVVTSITYGQSVASNAFTYSGDGIQIMGADGQLVPANQSASLSAGTDFGMVRFGSAVTNWLAITNTGAGAVTFSGSAVSGSPLFHIDASFSLPPSLAGGAATNVPVVCDATLVGDLSATLYFSNSTIGVSSNYPVNLAASVYWMSTNAGPFQGGQAVTISNGVMGSGSDINAVLFHTNRASVVSQGTSWVSVITPPTEASMTCDVTVMSESLGSTVLGSAYTYREESVTENVDPATGPASGGTSVTLSGQHLNNGSSEDVYKVTVCGVDVMSIDSVSAAQLEVTTAAGPGGPGDVVVYTHDYGMITWSNAFTYEGAGISVYGADGGRMDNRAAPSVASGTAMNGKPRTTVTNWFTIKNDGSAALEITSALIEGADGALFTASVPGSVDAGASAAFPVEFSPTNAGDFAAALTLSNSCEGADGTFVINLKGSGYTLTASEGPWTGGHSVTIFNGALGSGTDITQVLVNAHAAVITAQGTNWVAIAVPASTNGGLADIRVDSTSLGSKEFGGAYTYHKGALGGILDDWTQWEEKVGFASVSWVDMPNYTTAAVYSNAIYAGGGKYRYFVYTNGAASWTMFSPFGSSYTNYDFVTFNDHLMTVGGNGSAQNYYLDEGSMITCGVMRSTSYRLGGAEVLNGRLHYIGSTESSLSLGGTSTTNKDSAWIANPVPLASHIGMGTAVLSNRFYSFGGCRSDSGSIVYDNAYYTEDGTNWSSMESLPEPRRFLDATVFRNQIYVLGGYSDGGNAFSGTASSNVWRWTGSVWEEMTAMPSARACLGAVTYQDQIWAMGGFPLQTNVYAYPAQVFNPGADPDTGACEGSYQVRLWGTDLHAGWVDDITSVSIGGMEAEVLSVAGTTQVIVQVNGGAFGLQDVILHSTLCGSTTSSNAFRFTGADITPLGTDGVAIANGEAASVQHGTCFGTLQAGSLLSRTLIITNEGQAATTIYGMSVNGMAADSIALDFDSFPVTLPALASTNLTITWTASGSGMQDVGLAISNSTIGAPSNYVIHLQASVLGLDKTTYSTAGGDTLTISNGVAFGSGFDITQVQFGNVFLTPVAQGSNWVQVMIPPGELGRGQSNCCAVVESREHHAD